MVLHGPLLARVWPKRNRFREICHCAVYYFKFGYLYGCLANELAVNEDALTRAFLEFRDGLRRVVRRFVDNSVDVEDIVQEAYARSLEASKKRPISSPKAYLARSARNLALNHIAKASSSGTENVPAEDIAADPFRENFVEERVEAERQLQAYCLAIEQLPVQCRRVFTLKQVYGLTQKEIATRLAISEKSVEYHVSKGLLHCRQYLRKSMPVAGNDVRVRFGSKG